MDTNKKNESVVKIKEPLKCWGCGEPHLLRDCPHKTIHNIQALREETAVNDITQNIPRVSAALEDHQD